MSRHFSTLPEAPVTNPMGSPSPWGLYMGASSGASHHLAVMRKVTAKAKSEAFKSRQDAHFAALPRPLGRDNALAARAALLPGFSPAPRRAPRLGTPFGGASRALPARPARRAGLALDGPPQTSSLPVGSESVCPRLRARLRRGCPSAEKRALGERGFAPRSKIAPLGALLCLGAKFFGGSSPIPASEESGSCRLYAFRPASRFPTARGSLAAQRRWGAIIFTFLF